MSYGPLEFQLLQQVLEAFFLESDLPNEARFSCRCSDNRYNTLTKIVNVVATDAGLPNAAQFFPRQADSEAVLARKLLVDLGGECRCSPDNLYNLWRKILEQVRINSGNPDSAFFAWRFLDDRNTILLKILRNLQNAVTPPVPPVEFCCGELGGDWESITMPAVVLCDWGQVTETETCQIDWGAV